MSGEELKKYIKSSGLTMSDVARELGTTPQNVQARLGRKTIKIDFIQKIKEIIDKCAQIVSPVRTYGVTECAYSG